MASKILKNSMLEAVDNQLRLNEPPCAKETYERLVASGVDKKRAKEMIAAVLIEEMYYVLKNKEHYKEQRYVQRLSELKEDSFAEGDDSFEGHEEESVEDTYINTQTVVKGFNTGRNDPCPCGSGKKYKKCCGK